MPRKDYTVHLEGKPYCEHSKVYNCGKCRAIALENARTNGVVDRRKVGAQRVTVTFGDTPRWPLQCRASMTDGVRRKKGQYLILAPGTAEGAHSAHAWEGYRGDTGEEELPESWHVIERDLQGEPETDLSASLLAIFWATGWDSLTLQERMLLWATEEGKESLLKPEYRK